MSNWPVEEIPDEDALYYRVHKTVVENGKPTPGAFRDIGDAMSVDWSKYTDPAGTQARARIPGDNGVIALNAGKVRDDAAQTVVHEPSRGTRAHSGVVGEKSEAVRLTLRRMAIWMIPL